MKTLQHGRVELALHALREGEGDALLLLHELGADAASLAPGLPRWGGPVYGLDFSGHGHSGWLRGGAYQAELLVADADAALTEIGQPLRVCGHGLGAWVALLLAGARPDAVRAAVLCPGAGLDGGGAQPNFSGPLVSLTDAELVVPPGESCDPAALACFRRDIRPTAYAVDYAKAATRLVLLEDGTPRPPWWQAVAEVPGVVRCTAGLDAALLAASSNS